MINKKINWLKADGVWYFTGNNENYALHIFNCCIKKLKSGNFKIEYKSNYNEHLITIVYKKTIERIEYEVLK